VAALTVQIRQTSCSASEAIVRGHRVPIDRPVDKGGSDRGAMGGELFLASIGGCFMSTLLAAIRAREAETSIRNVRVDVAGTLEQSPARFVAVELSVSAEGDDRALLDELVEVAGNGCIMVNTLRASLNLTIAVGTAIKAGA